MAGLKNFVTQGMRTDVESVEERVKRLKCAALPGVGRASLDLYYDDRKEDGEAYTARLELRMDGGGLRTVHARCASFGDALKKIEEYEACLAAGRKTPDFEVCDDYGQDPGDGPDADGPFETRAEFTTWLDVWDRHLRAGKKGGYTHDPRTVADLPRLNHGMAVAVPVTAKDGTVRWHTDWFDYACYKKDSKEIVFVCIHDEHKEVFPLDPYIGDAINQGRKVPQAYSLWLKKTVGDVRAVLRNSNRYR